MTDALEIKSEDIKHSEEMVAVDSVTKLKVMVFRPTLSRGKSPVIFVAGWVSNFSGWASFITTLAREHDVYYLETREKDSACIIHEHLLQDSDFSIQQNAKDIIRVCEHFGINAPPTIACGSSLGATSLLEAMKGKKLNVGGAFLIGPNSEFRAPRSLLWILSLPSSFYKPFSYFLIWYLRNFRVDAKKEPEQMARYTTILKQVNASRLKHSARSTILGKYYVWKDLETIRGPVCIAYAPTDKLHNLDNILQMAKKLPYGKLHACPTNLYMHSEKLVKDFNAFEQSIQNRLSA